MRKSFTRLFGLLMLFCIVSIQVVATAPTVPAAGLDPVNGFLNVRPDNDNGTVFVMNFDQPVQAGSLGGIHSGIISLNQAGVQLDPIQITGPTSTSPTTGSTVVIEGNKVTVTFQYNFVEENSYYITVSSDAIQNASGEYFTGISGIAPRGWDFTVGDFTAPKLAVVTGVKQLNPRDNAQGVNVAAPFALTATFDEPILAGTGMIGIYTADGAVVEMINVTDATKIAIAGNTLTITPATALNELTEYYIRIQQGAITDDVTAYGGTANVYGGINTNIGWNFLTADITAPTAAVTPAAITAPQQPVVVTFSDNRAGVVFDPKESVQTLSFDLCKNATGTPYAIGDAVTGLTAAATAHIGALDAAYAGGFTYIYTAKNTVTITPTAALPTGYDVTISVAAGSNLYDNEGNQVVAGVLDVLETADFMAPGIASTTITRKSDANTSVKIEVNVNDNLQGYPAASLPSSVKYICKTAAETAPTAAEVLANGSVMPLRTTPASNNIHVLDNVSELSSKTNYVFYYVASDSKGNTSALFQQAFKTADTEAPTYTYAVTNDLNNVEQKADKAAFVTITFNEAVYSDAIGTVFTPATLAAALEIFESDGTTVPTYDAAISADNKTITITPTGNWKNVETYSFKFKNNAVYDYPTLDAFYVGEVLSIGTSKAISGDTKKYFTVEDYQGPTATFAPANGLTNQSVTTKPTVTFDETVYNENGIALNNDPSSEAWVGFYVFLRHGKLPTDPLIVNTGGNISITGNVVTFSPGELLSENDYYVHVSGNVQDSFGSKYFFEEDNATAILGYAEDFATWRTVDAVKPVVAIDVVDNVTYTSLGIVDVDLALNPTPLIELQISEGTYFQGNAIAGLTDNNEIRPQIVLKEGGVNGTSLDFDIFGIYTVLVVDDPIAFTVETIIRLRPIAPLTTGSTYYVAINTLTDVAGNAFLPSQASGTFTTKGVPTLPTISAFSPADGATAVSVADQTLKITFDRPIEQGTFTNATEFVTIYNSDGTALVAIDITLGALSISSNVATITIPAGTPLLSDRKYYVQISGGAFKDANGNFFAGITDATTWNFETEDKTKPLATTITPINETVGVAQNFVVDITFNEPVTIGTGEITIHSTSGFITGKNTIDVQGTAIEKLSTPANTFRIKQGKTFPYNTNIGLEIPATAFKDAAGNYYVGISGPATHTFTITANPGMTVAAWYPADNSDRASLTDDFYITFSEPAKFTATPGRINIFDKAAGAIAYQAIDLTTPEGMALVYWNDDNTKLYVKHNVLKANTDYSVVIDANTIVDKETSLEVLPEVSATSSFPDADGWDFTTKDLTAPVAVWTDVTAGAYTKLAAQKQSFVITFDEAVRNIDNSAITDANAAGLFTLTPITVDAVTPTLSAKVSGNTITLTPATDLTTEAQYTLSLATAVQDNSDNQLVVPVAFNFQVVDVVAPVMTLADGAAYSDKSFGITINLTNETIGTTAKVYYMAVAKGATAPTVDELIANGTSADYTILSGAVAYTVAGLANYTNYDIYAAAVDASGNKSAAVSSLLNVWTLDKIAPQLVSVTPANGLQQVDPSMPFELTLTFNEDVVWIGPSANLGTATGTGLLYGLTLREKNTQVRIPINNVENVADDNKKLRATTIAALNENTEYYVELDYNTIVDNPVNTLVAPYSQVANAYTGAIIGKTAWTFKTGDITGLNLATTGTPVVNKLTPLDQSTKVSPIASAQPLILEFDEEIVKGTGTIYLYRVGTATNPLEIIDVASSAVTVNGKIATITRNNNLTTDITYYVVIPATAFMDKANTVAEDGTVIGPNYFAGLNTAGYVLGDWEFTAADLIAPVASFSSYITNLNQYPATDGLVRTDATYGNPVVPAAVTAALPAVFDDRTVILTLTEAVATAPAVGDFTFVKKSDNSAVAFTVTNSGLVSYIQPTVALASNTTYVVTLKANALKDAENNYVSTKSFEFTTWDEESPIATFTPANAATNVTLDGKIIIELDKAVVKGPFYGAAENLALSAADLTSFITLTNVNTGAPVAYTLNILEAGKKFELTPNAPLVSSNGATIQRYNVTINVAAPYMKDLVYSPYGNIYTGLVNGALANFSQFSTEDVIAPNMVAHNPLTTTPFTEVANNAALTVTFTENVAAGAGKIQIRRNNGQLFDEVLASACTYVGNTVTIPHKDFEDFTTYYVVIPAGAITDVAGNAYAATDFAGALAYTEWKFCTGDGQNPYVVTYDPVQDAENVPGDANLVLTFSEDVRLSGVAGELVIYHNNGAAHPRDDGNTEERINLASAQVTVAGNVITVNPTITFDKNGTYYVRITPGAIEDLAGNDYAGITDNTTWRFSITDWTPITLIDFAPDYADVNVPVTTTLTMTFDRDVLAGTGYIKLFEYIYNTNTFAVEERLAFQDVPGLENGFPVNSDYVTIAGDVVTITLPGELRDNIDFYYVLVDAGSFTNINASDINEFAGISNPFTWRFKTAADTQLPELASALVDAVSPIDATCIDKSSLELTMSFTEPIMAGAGNIVIYNKADDTVAETIPAAAGTYSNIDPFTATFVPTALEDLTSYYVMVEADAIKDKATASEFPELVVGGTINYFDSSVIAAGDWSFTTGDVTAPALSAMSPADADVNVGADIDFVLTFAEEVQLVAEGETAGKFFVTEDGATEPFFSTEISAEMINVNVVTVPVAGLADNTLYNVTFEANMITDMAGDCGTIRGNEAFTTGWSFTTGDNTLPVVTATPESADAAADTFNVVLTFSEAVANVDETTILVANGSLVPTSLVDNGDLTFDVQFAGVDGDTLVVTFADAIVDANNNKLAAAEFRYVIGDNVAPQFVAGLPNTVLGASDGIDLSVTFDDVVAGVAGKNVEIYKIGAAAPVAVIDAATFTTEDGMTFSTPLTVIDNADYFVLIEAGAFVDETAAPKGADFAGIADNTTWAFSIWDVTFCADDITLTPADGTVNLPVTGNELVINFCEPVQLTADFIVFVAPSDNIAAGFSYTAATVSADGYTVTIPVTDELASATVYTVTVPSFGITDMAGNTFHNAATIYNGGIINGEIWNFTTADVEAPTAVVTPGEGENLANNFVVKVKFSETVTVPANAISATGAAITVTGAENEYEVAIVAEDNATVVLTLANTIVDAAGNKLTAASYTYKVGDNTAPAVEAVTPLGTTEDAHPVLTMTLDENVVAGAGKLTIYNGAEVAQEFSVSDAAVSISGNTVTVTLSESLDKFTEYFVLVDAGFVKDAAGNNFAGINTPATWSFTTGDFKVGVVDLAKSIKVYPTVFNSYINIEVSSDVVLTKAVITNIAGQTIKEFVNPNNTIETSDLRSGVYFISLQTEDGIAKTERIIKR